MADSNTATVAVRVDESLKDEWKDTAANSTDYNNLSHLIRTAVQKEIGGEYVKADRPTGQSGEPSSNPEMKQAVEQLQGQIDEMQGQIDEMQSETKAEANYDIEQVLLELLPDTPDTGAGVAGNTGPAKIGASPGDLADRIGADRDKVAGVVDRLSDRHGYIQKGDGRDGETYYWSDA